MARPFGSPTRGASCGWRCTGCGRWVAAKRETAPHPVHVRLYGPWEHELCGHPRSDGHCPRKSCQGLRDWRLHVRWAVLPVSDSAAHWWSPRRFLPATNPPPQPASTAHARDAGVSLTEKKKCSGTSFPKKARGHSMCPTMVGGSWRLAVGGGWRLAVGNWRLVVVGGGWRRLVAGGWWLEAVGSGWQLAVGRHWRLAAVGGWRLVVGGWWRLAVDGSWRLAVGGLLGRSLRAVLSKKKKKSRPLRTPLT